MAATPDRSAQLLARELPFTLHANEGIWHLEHGCGQRWAIGEPGLVEATIAQHARDGCPVRKRPRLTARDKLYLFVAGLCMLWAVAVIAFAVPRHP